MERNTNHERAAVAGLAAAYGNTDAGRDVLAGHVDLNRTHALSRRLALSAPDRLTVRPGVAHVDVTLHSESLRRSVTCSVAIGEATLPSTRRSIWISAGDRTGPRLSGLDAADYLAVPAGELDALLNEVREQLTGGAAALYRAGERLREDQQRTQRVAGEVWEPSAAAIDALSELLEQDARWKAFMLVNDWYVRTVDAVQATERVTPHQPVLLEDGLHQLPAPLCELLNEHWRAVYTRTVDEQLHIIDAFDTPGETAMRAYFDAQELRQAQEAQQANDLGFPEVGTDRGSDPHGPHLRGPDPRGPDPRGPDPREDGDERGR